MPAEKGPHALTPAGLDGSFLRAGGCRAARAPLTYTRRCTPDLGAAVHPQPAHERPFARAFRRWCNRPSSSRWWGWTSHFSELAVRERHAPPQHAPEGTLRILAPPVTHRPIARFFLTLRLLSLYSLQEYVLIMVPTIYTQESQLGEPLGSPKSP